MSKTIYIYGITGGVVLSLLFLGPVGFNPEMYFDPEWMEVGEIFGFGVMAIAMLSVFFGVRAAKAKSSRGFSYGRALLTGMLITLLVNVIFYLANVFMYEVIAPGFLEKFGTHYREQMLETAPATDREDLSNQLNTEMKMLQNPWMYAFLMAATTFTIGIVISLLSALIFGRKRKPQSV